MNKLFKSFFIGLFLMITSLTGQAQTDSTLLKEINSLKETVNDYRHRFDVLEKQIDDLMWCR